MKPLYWVAIGLGLLMLVLRTEGGFDLYSDPAGWVLVLGGLRLLVRQQPQLPLQQALWTLGAIALVIAAVRVAPDIDNWLRDTDAGSDARVFTVWADIPSLAFQAVLAHILAGQALTAGVGGARFYWRLVEVALIVGGIAAGLYAVSDADWLGAVGEIGWLGVLLCMFGCLIFGAREWAGGGPPPELKPRASRK